MSQAKLHVLFKKIQKDDKKEVLEFHVQGDELPHSDELVQMAGSIVVLNVTNSEAGELNVEFKSIQRDSKKTTLKFNIIGDSKVIQLYPHDGRTVEITMAPSQMSVDDFYDGEEHEGIEYQVNHDGTAAVVPNQMSLEDINHDEEDEGDLDGMLIGSDEDDDPFSGDDLLD
jgi:hypothetical protein